MIIYQKYNLNSEEFVENIEKYITPNCPTVKMADHANIANYINISNAPIAFKYVTDNWQYEHLIFDTIIIRDKEKRSDIKTIII